MPVKMTFHRGVAEDLKGYLAGVLVAQREHVWPEHNLEVIVVPAPSLEGRDGQYGFGCFVRPNDLSARGLTIWIAAGLADIVKPKREGRRAVASTLLHEFVHYEQFRDGRVATERGVQLRANNLLRKFETRMAAMRGRSARRTAAA